MPNPLVIPSGYWEVIVSVDSPGPRTPISFSFGVKAPDGDLANVLAACDSWFNTGVHAYKQFLGSDYTIRQAFARGFAHEGAVVEGVAGLEPSYPLPVNTCLKVRKDTGLVGKAHKGYMFVPGLLPDSVVGAGGLINSANLADYQTVMDGLFTAMNVAPLAGIYILHHALSSDTVPTLVNSLTCLPKAATQRRRLSPKP